jgi:propanediol dehydratase small subunit
MTMSDAQYPLFPADETTSLHSATGKNLADIHLDAVLAGELNLDDLQIHHDALLAQARIARHAGYAQLAHNLERAAELTRVPRAEIIAMYQQLRPGRSEFAELQALAARLLADFQAPLCAALVREAAETYRQRGLLKHPEAL